ncbi:MAG: bifunctional 4-hydroxy-2-oxoglutarate aldolase/2-dehydro-3-deoxy-phosphogluconate aldolase [Flavobacteriaceae bacterium]
MKSYTPSEIIAKMELTGLVPVFNHHDAETAAEVLINSYEAGIRVFEFTNRGANALEVFEHLVKVVSGNNDLVLGIGTIWTQEQAERFLDAGAQFIVSPALLPDIADSMNERNILWVPGCGTITEVNTAINIGARLVKIFPGNVLGPAFASAVNSVLPEVKLMPTGGVKPTAENLSDWFNAGVMCVGMGSQLFSRKLIEKGNFEQIQEEISDVLSLLRSVRDKV